MTAEPMPKVCRAAPASGINTPEYTITCREDYPVPEPKEGEILVRLRMTGICQSDHHAMNGDWGIPPEPGVDCTGHEGAGFIVALGPGVGNEWAIGQRVGISPVAKTCGECECCEAGRETLCLNTWYTACHVNGTYTQYCAIPAQWIIRLPEGPPLEQLAPFMCSGGTAYTAVKTANLQPGKFLVVMGAAGGVGHMVVQFAKAASLRVIGVDVGQDRADKVLESGAEFYFDATDSDLAEKVGKVTNGGAHAVIVTAGSGRAYAAAPPLLRNLGVIVALGLPQIGTAIAGADPSDICFRGLTVRGVHVTSRADMAEALQVLAAGKVKEHVTLLPFQAFPKALDDVAHSRVSGRQVVDFDA